MSLDQVAWGCIQMGLENLQGWILHKPSVLLPGCPPGEKFFTLGWPSSAQIKKLSVTPPRNILDGPSPAMLPFELLLQIEGQPCHICYSNRAAVL